MAKKEGAQKEKAQEKKKTCFIIMPVSTPKELWDTYFGDKKHFEHVLECLFVQAINNADFEPILPIAQGSDIIPAEIIKNLETSDLVLCDISSLNPNVFFELGIRTALNKPVAFVRDNYTKSIPFDTNTINHFSYSGSLDAWNLKIEIKNLSEHISKCYKRSNSKNSLWGYFGLTSTSQPAEKGTLEDKVDYLIKEMNSLKKEDVLDLSEIPQNIYWSLVEESVNEALGKYGLIPTENGVDFTNNYYFHIPNAEGISQNHPLKKELLNIARKFKCTIELVFNKQRAKFG